MQYRYNRDPSTLSRVRKLAYQLLDPVVDRLSRLDRVCYRRRLDDYCAAIANAGAPAPNCIGFIDSTYTPYQKPMVGQDQVYNGYYGGHGVKTLTVAFPDGMTGHTFGPCSVRAGDGRILRESNLEEEMKTLAYRNGRWQYFLYGDWAFGLRPWLWSQFRFPQSPGEDAFNKYFSQCRVAVEIDYHLTKTPFKTVTSKFKNSVRNRLSLRSMNHAIVIKNLRAIIKGGNQISSMFGLNPPALLEYINTQDLYLILNINWRNFCLAS